MLYFEDIDVGNRFSSGPYLLEADEITSFAQKWDPFDFHTDIEAAEASMFGGLTAPGVLTLCISNRLAHDFEPWSVQAMFGAEYRFPSPARVNDLLTLEGMIVARRESRSRPEAGIIESEDRLVNQIGTTVLELKGAVLISKRDVGSVGASEGAAADPRSGADEL